jgi:hypothetical protein
VLAVATITPPLMNRNFGDVFSRSIAAFKRDDSDARAFDVRDFVEIVDFVDVAMLDFVVMIFLPEKAKADSRPVAKQVEGIGFAEMIVFWFGDRVESYTNWYNWNQDLQCEFV